MWLRLGVLATLAVALVACDDREGGSSTSKAGGVTGQVVDAQGKPLQGAKLLVDNTVYYDANVTGSTGADGRYSIQVPTNMVGGVWYVYGSIERVYNGRTYTMDLHPESTETFNGDTGAVRNFQWKLTGQKVGRLTGHYGGTVKVVADPGAFYDFENVTLTLTPSGPLIDGSAGSTLQLRVPANEELEVPLGRYTISAVYAPPGQTAAPMKVRLSDVGEYASSVTVDFEPDRRGTCANCVYIDVLP